MSDSVNDRIRQEHMVHRKIKPLLTISQLQCRHLIPALNMRAEWAEYTTACPVATHFPWYGCMFDVQLYVALICKLHEPLKKTSGRLVQELNVCTVRLTKSGLRSKTSGRNNNQIIVLYCIFIFSHGIFNLYNSFTNYHQNNFLTKPLLP